jgi:hypothetical protein
MLSSLSSGGGGCSATNPMGCGSSGGLFGGSSMGGGFGSLLGGLSSLAGIFLGFQQYKLMKEQLGIAKDQWNTTKEEIEHIRNVRSNLSNQYSAPTPSSARTNTQFKTSSLASV